MKQLIAENHLTGMKIIQRYIDGVRYIKVQPKNLTSIIMDKIKKQFAERADVKFAISANGWIRMASAIGFKDDVLDKEAEMLRKSGFDIEMKEV